MRTRTLTPSLRPRSRRFALLSLAVAGALVAPLVPTAPAGAVSTPALDRAVAWLADQQQADGGFELAGFPGFETSDAIYALAAAGQADATWSTSEARAAVEAVNTGGATPKNPLDAVDDWVDSVQGDAGASAEGKAQQAAKVVVLVTEPLGLDATDFDPSDDSAAPVDLVAAIQGGAGSGDYAALPIGGKAYVLWALALLGEAIPAGLVSAIGAAQHPDGGFDFTGSPTGEGFDPDITASVVIGLRAAGRPQTDPIIRKAVTGLGFGQVWTGEWAGGYDDGNPNSTAMVMLMASTLGGPRSTCWRDAVEPRLTGVPYPSPVRALTRRQQPDGRISSPNDGFGINTFATSQAIQGLAAAEGAVFSTGGCSQPAASRSLRVAQAYYVDLLDRLTEPGGATYWAGQFDAGMSPALLAQRFVGTREYGQVVAARMIEELLGRRATAQERTVLGDLVRQGQRLVIRSLVLAGDEYADVNAALDDDVAWAEALYRDALGRPASGTDVDFVLAQLDAGRSYEAIARALVFSAEGRGAFVRATYRDLLRRNPSSSDIAFWGGELRRGVSPERLVNLIIGSAEYKASTAAPA